MLKAREYQFKLEEREGGITFKFFDNRERVSET